MEQAEAQLADKFAADQKAQFQRLAEEDKLRLALETAETEKQRLAEEEAEVENQRIVAEEE